MAPNIQQMLQQVVIPALLIFLMVAGATGLLLGLGLLVRSDLVLRLGARMNRWVSLRQLLKPAEVTRDSWQLVQRNRRWLALLMLVGALYTMRGLLLIDQAAAAAALAASWHINGAGAAWLTRSAIWFLMLGNAVALAVSLMLGFAPALLARIDAHASRWISTRNAMRGASTIHCTFDHWALHWPRLTGALIALFSLVEIVCVARAMH